MDISIAVELILAFIALNLTILASAVRLRKVRNELSENISNWLVRKERSLSDKWVPLFTRWTTWFCIALVVSMLVSRYFLFSNDVALFSNFDLLKLWNAIPHIVFMMLAITAVPTAALMLLLVLCWYLVTAIRFFFSIWDNELFSTLSLLLGAGSLIAVSLEISPWLAFSLIVIQVVFVLWLLISSQNGKDENREPNTGQFKLSSLVPFGLALAVAYLGYKAYTRTVFTMVALHNEKVAWDAPQSCPVDLVGYLTLENVMLARDTATSHSEVHVRANIVRLEQALDLRTETFVIAAKTSGRVQVAQIEVRIVAENTNEKPTMVYYAKFGGYPLENGFFVSYFRPQDNRVRHSFENLNNQVERAFVEFGILPQGSNFKDGQFPRMFWQEVKISHGINGEVFIERIGDVKVARCEYKPRATADAP